MVSKFADRDIAYTVRTESRDGLLDALDTLEPRDYEIIINPLGDVNRFTLRTEDRPGVVQALNDLTPEWHSAVVRVFQEAAA